MNLDYIDAGVCAKNVGKIQTSTTTLEPVLTIPTAAKEIWKNEDDTIPVDNSPLLDKKRKKVVQQVIGTCLYYACAVDRTILPAISSIASTQANATEESERRVKQLLY